jgi:hypothetical protein
LLNSDDGEEFTLPIYPREYHSLARAGYDVKIGDDFNRSMDDPMVFICFGNHGCTMEEFIHQVKLVVINSRQGYPEWMARLFWPQPPVRLKEEALLREIEQTIFVQA